MKNKEYKQNNEKSLHSQEDINYKFLENNELKNGMTGELAGYEVGGKTYYFSDYEILEDKALNDISNLIIKFDIIKK